VDTDTSFAIAVHGLTFVREPLEPNMGAFFGSSNDVGESKQLNEFGVTEFGRRHESSDQSPVVVQTVGLKVPLKV
jgi:hypothetical protein